jgi:hypothetical protein
MVMRADAAQIQMPINRTQQVILWHMIFQRELVKQRRLRFLLRPHHHQSSRSLGQLNQRFVARSRKSFSTQSARCRHSLRLAGAGTVSPLLPFITLWSFARAAGCEAHRPDISRTTLELVESGTNRQFAATAPKAASEKPI